MTPEPNSEPQKTGLGLNDYLFILFRHKGKLIFSLVVSLMAAAGVYFFYAPVYESQVKLMVRYVLDRSAVDSLDAPTRPIGAGSSSENMINSEVEILTSWDLARQVAETVGVERLLPSERGTATKAAAARAIRLGLTVTALKGSNVILVSYKNRDAELTMRVLEELVRLYFEKHLEIHRSVGAFEFVSQQTDQVRARLSQTEEELKRLKAKAGIISLAESTANLNASIAKSQEELQINEAQLAEQRARVNELEKWFGASAGRRPPGLRKGESEAGLAAGKPDDNQQYEAILLRLAQLRQTRFELLAKYTPQARQVRLNETQLGELEAQRRELETRFPALTASHAVTGGAAAAASQPDLLTEGSRLAGLEAKSETLKAQVASNQDLARRLSELGTPIAQLERTKEVEEANYKYFQASLEKARIDEALDPTKIPNISVVQQPSPALRATRELKKILLGLLGGGMALGIGWVLARELVFDQTIKRALEIETGLRLPLLLSIPDLTRNRPRPHRRPKRLRPPGNSGFELARAEVPPWDPHHFIRPFTEDLRDRLGLFFSLNNMTHNPKLIGVTGLADGAGVSTLAAGLAADLSQTGDGKVLLVDMNASQGKVHGFSGGRPACSLVEVLEGRAEAPAEGENLFLATGAAPEPQEGVPMQSIPHGFNNLLPGLKASDFDYIIFDLPPLDRGSVTLALAGYMDKVLLVLEAEKCHRDRIKRVYRELIDARASVSVVFNKARSYGPKCLQEAV